MPQLRSHGLALDLPRGWHGSITSRSAACDLAVLHAATVALPAERADAGGGVIERLGWRDVFVALLEHEATSAGTPLFSNAGLALPLSPAWLVAGALQGMRPIQSGVQRFFSQDGRAFSLFVVVGEHAARARLLGPVNTALATLRIGPAVPGPGP